MGSFSHVELLLTLCSIVHISWNKELIKAHNINGIALEIIKANPGKNLVLAPFAFRFPLCKLATVAHGDTKHELMAVLEIKKAEDTKTCFSTMYMDVGRLLESDMTMLNMIYVNYTDDISNQFMSDASSFGVMVSKIGFHYPNAAITFVNSEFDSKTYKRINDVLEQNDVNSNSSILLVNGMHFKASWENNFKVQNTKKKAFRSHNNQTSEVLLMNGVQQCLYLDDESGRYKGISLKLVNFGVSIMFLLPDISVSIDKLLSKIIHTPGALQKITKKMKWDNVNVFLPRFKIKTRLDWTEYFNQFGLKRTTNSSSTELNAILNKNTGNNMYLSQAKQKVFLDINEMGTHSQNIHDEFDLRNHQESRELPETAYNTLKEFLADRPFLFFINMMTMTEVSTEFDVISGVYYGPE
ncbi:serine protease inhibitor 3/4-like [Choristoneura fumiferana]|uniref:serine protease inhibitor 3/4-like n=1 Tax=Choristoneura fumiferana TaxID=7141 RepID=UPI003D15A370